MTTVNRAIVVTKWRSSGDNAPELKFDAPAGVSVCDITGQLSENLPPACNAYLCSVSNLSAAQLTTLKANVKYVVLMNEQYDNATGAVVSSNYDDVPTAAQLTALKNTIQTRFPSLDDDKLTESGQAILQSGLTRRQLLPLLVKRWKRLNKSAKSIADLIAAASQGAVITLPGGTYIEWVRVDKAVTIQAAPGATVVIRAPAGVAKGSFEVTANAHLIGLTIDGINRVRVCDIYNNPSVVMDNCIIENGYGNVPGEFGQGVIVQDGSHLTATGCTFRHINGIVNEGRYCHGIYGGGIITNCTFDDIGGNGVCIYTGDVGACGEKTISGSYFSNCQIAIGGYCGIVEVFNNTIDNCQNGIAMDNNIQRAYIHHNHLANGIIGLQSSAWGAFIESVLFEDNTVASFGRGIYCENRGEIPPEVTITFRRTVFVNCTDNVILALDAAHQVIVEAQSAVSVDK